jgi:hypothetical protein
MDWAWLALVQARDVLTLARNALIEARFVADEIQSAWARRGALTCKRLWAKGLGPREMFGWPASSSVRTPSGSTVVATHRPADPGGLCVACVHA